MGHCATSGTNMANARVPLQSWIHRVIAEFPCPAGDGLRAIAAVGLDRCGYTDWFIVSSYSCGRQCTNYFGPLSTQLPFELRLVSIRDTRTIDFAQHPEGGVQLRQIRLNGICLVELRELLDNVRQDSVVISALIENLLVQHCCLLPRGGACQGFRFREGLPSRSIQP